MAKGQVRPLTLQMARAASADIKTDAACSEERLDGWENDGDMMARFIALNPQGTGK